MTLPDNSSSSQFRLDTSILSDVGSQRSSNEDYAMAFLPDDPAVLHDSGCLFIVADGEGATASGEEVSRYATGKVFAGYYEMVQMPPEDRLRLIMREVGNDLYHQAEGDGFIHAMTTLVAASVLENRLTIASVGNSRAYLVHDGQAQQITRDHNQLSELFNMGELSVEEVETAGGQNKLTRSIGGQQDVEVDIFTNIPIFPGDLLLLCSDGLTQYVSDEQIALLVDAGTLDQIAQRLVNQAKDFGGEDNITVLLVGFREVEEGPPANKLKEARLHEPHFLPIPNAKPAVEKRKNESQNVRKHLILLSTILFAMILVWFIWHYFSGLPFTAPSQPVAVTETSQPVVIVTVKVTPQLLPTVTRYVETPEVTPPEPSPQPQVEPTADTCIYPVKPGQTLFSIIRGFELTYNADQAFAYYQTCDLERLVCSGERNPVESHANILAGWNIVIPVASEDACKTGQGIWVSIGE